MDISQDVQAIQDKLTQRRRDFHMFPESGWVEYRTAAIVAEQLNQLNYQVYVREDASRSSSRMGVPAAEVLQFHENRAISEGADPVWVEQMKGGHTAVVGVIRTGKPGPVIALRFDMDSNDLTESASESHRPVQEGFSSRHAGMMHACGHDGHTAIGLGVAEILAKHKDRLCGEIRLLFQPAEEGSRGAKSMVDAGWLDNVDYFFGGHIAFKSKTLGEIVASINGFLATTKINVTYTGIAAHAGAAPEEGRSALLAAAAASLHLNGISRHSGGATRINVGTLEAGSGRNIVADKALMKLETRGGTTELNHFVKNEAIRIIENVAIMYNVACEWEIVGEAPGAESSPELIPVIRQAVEQMGSVKSFIPSMDLGGSEDIVYMMNRVQQQGGKASYLLFGSPLEDGHHQVGFDFDENVLVIGTELLIRLVLACQETIL
ncbi:amidohydrolase [Paenibacillus radicis (ex Xue et al. 2023)]|uniref:Amidohydrolase n=1 Tax=Paenibacillus radicis (ex Xue et al. 2023) TaxID=2972489 RepID=A0ABT1YFB3_9BACL|nr:amidohydrolase [Paenibacillus radicis (ex Xue et al. 2023)]MCR8631886.1 amidohydrolase [Paenibacillus radicis (ex Xue et al. 2023)]